MNEQQFRSYLKKRGKKAHVVDVLIEQVRQFETFLQHDKGRALKYAVPDDLQAYADGVEARRPGAVGKSVRGLILYYQFCGEEQLAAKAAELREEQVAGSRSPFLLKDFMGVEQTHLEQLRSAGVVNVKQMLSVGSTPEGRRSQANQSGVPAAVILELVKLSDLARIPGVKGIRARLYYGAGAETPQQIADWEPVALGCKLAGYVERSGFPGIAPLPKEVEFTVTTARRLPSIVDYGPALEAQDGANSGNV